MEYNGKDVAEAIRNACEKLNVAREDLDISILETGSAGIFGLCKKKAKIKVSIKETEAQFRKKRSPKATLLGAFSRKKGKEIAAREVKSRPEAGVHGHKPDRDAIAVPAEILDEVKVVLDKLISLIGFSVETAFSADGNKIKAHIAGDELEAIVGSEGQTIDGLQYVLRKIISRKYPEKILFALDAGDFRESRARELEEMSLKLAEEVKDTGKTRSIPALNPAERRTVHMVLQNDNTIRSRSVGEGLYKKILIYVPGKGRKKTPRKPKGSNPMASR
jgi:spoIIIJ-associated protein